MNPLITIITVTYNAEETIERTLRSVEEQTYPSIEHIIVDGCSTDGTIGLVRHYVEHNEQPRKHTIRVMREPDNGLYDAMNKGIGLATGVYIVFLNAGDCFHEKDTIEKVMKQAHWNADHRNYAVLYGETDLVDNDGNFVRHRRLKAPTTLTPDSFKSGMLVCHQSFYARTDLAKRTPYDLRFRYSADFDWCVRILKEAKRRNLRNLNTGLILTDYLSEGMSTKYRRRSLIERLRMMARHYGWPTAIGYHLWFVVRAIIKR